MGPEGEEEEEEERTTTTVLGWMGGRQRAIDRAAGRGPRLGASGPPSQRAPVLSQRQQQGQPNRGSTGRSRRTPT
uniref:Uncharacterized protein n=1 Tax=Plectus sambesii TaxID=2011161 RepID=A0A914VRJ8_9BILA